MIEDETILSYIPFKSEANLSEEKQNQIIESLYSISIGFIFLPLFDGGQIISNIFLYLYFNKLTNKILMIYNFIEYLYLIFLLISYDFKRLL